MEPIDSSMKEKEFAVTWQIDVVGEGRPKAVFICIKCIHVMGLDISMYPEIDIGEVNLGDKPSCYKCKGLIDANDKAELLSWIEKIST